MRSSNYRFGYLQVTTIEYREVQKLFPHVAAAIRLNVSGVIAGRGDKIQYVHTDSNPTDPLYRLINSYRLKTMTEKYLEMLLDSPEAVFSVFGFSSSF